MSEQQEKSEEKSAEKREEDEYYKESNFVDGKLVRFTVKRSEWGQGRMVRGGARCCLGFMGRALGYTDRELERQLMPFNVLAANPEANCRTWPVDRYGSSFALASHSDSRAAWAAANINDSPSSKEDKERKLVALFAQNGITCEFVD